MKRILVILWIMMIILFNISLFSKTEKSKKKSSKKWSSYQGRMSWHDSKVKCKRLRMRLPTKDELLKAFNAGETESWNPKNGYWVESNSPYAYTVSIADGTIEKFEKPPRRFVRCIH